MKWCGKASCLPTEIVLSDWIRKLEAYATTEPYIRDSYLAPVEDFVSELTATCCERLRDLGQLLIDQERARVIVDPQRPAAGHWFGGGNMVQDNDGTLWLVGRFRNQGDSRTGLGMGERGLELAIFSSDDRGESWTKTLSLNKRDLNVDSREVLSIEGTALRLTDSGVELYLSTEKTGIEYPYGLKSYLKPGTGVWTVDRITAPSIQQLADGPVETILASEDPRTVQVKDPFIFQHNGETHLLFCTHPFCWSSSNTGYVKLDQQSQFSGDPDFDFFPRGYTWDVAMTRGTSVVPVPRVGLFADQDVALFFYDGGECVRNLDQHAAAVKRPRGYSCEELGGLACIQNGDLATVQRLSINQPAFVSPFGTGCSRYVDVLATDDGYYATWQQSQADLSQPLVMHFVSRDDVAKLLTS